MTEIYTMPVHLLIIKYIQLGAMLSETVLKHPIMQMIMKTRNYDLVVVDTFATEAIFGLGQHFGASTIALSAFGQSTWTNDLVGNPAAVSTVPSSASNFSCRMSLWQRLQNLLVTAYERIMLKLIHHPTQVGGSFELHKSYFVKKNYTI